jgi:hypothetical protein
MSIVGEISPQPERFAGFSFGGFDQRRFSTVTAVRFSRLDASGKSPAYVDHRRNQPESRKVAGFSFGGLIRDGFQPPPPSGFET